MIWIMRKNRLDYRNLWRNSWITMKIMVMMTMTNKVKNVRTRSHFAWVTIDEKLEAIAGNCSFKQYIPSKPSKYGNKIFAISDTKYIIHVTQEFMWLISQSPFKTDNSTKSVCISVAPIERWLHTIGSLAWSLLTA